MQFILQNVNIIVDEWPVAISGVSSQPKLNFDVVLLFSRQ